MKWTANRIRQLKGSQKITCLTAYDYTTARIIDSTGVQLILVGDSLGMMMLGYENTLPVSMPEMLMHAAAVVRGTKEALVVADMPFMSYQASVEQGITNAGRFIKRAGAGAVKIEGGAFRVPLIKALVENGIPVLGHIGLTPQSIKEMGGYKVQGRKRIEADQLVRDARALQRAGVFAMVLEGVPEPLGRVITRAVKVPVIGIGGGKYCDGQILVTHDLLGLFSDFTPKFAKKYVDLGNLMKKAFLSYKNEVETGRFPGREHCY